MARLPRLYLPGCAQHIIQRGNNRQACFNADEDYRCYLHHLHDASKKYGVAIHAFVLMTNHVHLLATPSDESGVSKIGIKAGQTPINLPKGKATAAVARCPTQNQRVRAT